MGVLSLGAMDVLGHREDTALYDKSTMISPKTNNHITNTNVDSVEQGCEYGITIQ